MLGKVTFNSILLNKNTSYVHMISRMRILKGALNDAQKTTDQTVVKPLPKLGTAADPFRFMDAHCWDFTK